LGDRNAREPGSRRSGAGGSGVYEDFWYAAYGDALDEVAIIEMRKG
jgi:hypothetical protein